MTVKSICGIILLSKTAESLAQFYGHVLQVEFEREDHGGLEVHFGVNIGEVHFAIHPPANFKGTALGSGPRTAVAFNVDSIKPYADRLAELKAEQLIEPHDEGFGTTATWRDPEGNLLELVELNFDFEESH